MARKIGKAYSLSVARGDACSSGKEQVNSPSYSVDVETTEEDWGERDAFGQFQSKTSSTRLITIEAREHRHLLRLYYAAYDDMKKPSAKTEAEYMCALERCNDFYAGGSSWQ